ELIGDLIPKGVVNIVNGFGSEAGQSLATHDRINKIAFTGETTTGRIIMQNASQNIIPVTLELGGKSPNIFAKDVMDADDDYLENVFEGLVMSALNQAEVCTCPSPALIHDDIYDEFINLVIDRVEKIQVGNPFDEKTLKGAQTSKEQKEKISSYLE